MATTDFTDGTHGLTLMATDAAGNSSTVASEEIEIDNNAPPAPVGLAANPTQPDGTSFAVSWGEPSEQVAPITQATLQVCPSDGAGACTPATIVPANGPAAVTVPGPGSWNIAVWLTDAAGNGTQGNAAHTIVNVPANSSKNPPGGSGQEGTRPRTSTEPPAISKTTIRLSETLNGRVLIVHVSGPASGHVRVAFTARLGRSTVASSARTLSLEHGRLTAKFKLGPRTAAHAKIRVSAQLDHKPSVTSTLHRAPAKHR